jgi:hypothetical protein
MKKQTTNQFSTVILNQVEKLTSVANETLAMEFHQVRTFSPADLWNIQRRGRTMMQRRHFA